MPAKPLPLDDAEARLASESIRRLERTLRGVLFGQDRLVELVVIGVLARGPDRPLVGGVEQQRGVALGDDGEGGRDVGLRHVVVAHVVVDDVTEGGDPVGRSEEHTSELQSH